MNTKESSNNAPSSSTKADIDTTGWVKTKLKAVLPMKYYPYGGTLHHTYDGGEKVDEKVPPKSWVLKDNDGNYLVVPEYLIDLLMDKS